MTQDTVASIVKAAMAAVAARETAAEQLLRQASMKVVERIALTDLPIADDGELQDGNPDDEENTDE
jgi:hypothetical protein